MEAQERLLKEGLELNMCQKFQDEWDKPNTAQLCRMFFRGMDFCIEHDWPSVATMKELFSVEEAQRNGVYFADGESIAQTNICVLGNATVDVYVPASGVCDIYARHNSNVRIHAGVGAFVYVSILDNSRVDIMSKANGARINASYFGGTIADRKLFDKIHDKTHKEE